jgi:tetratricopeptide (TPR) repeat protein
VPDPARVAAALAMTTRGLRLAPHDADLQFTHAMLLLDAERAGDPARANELLALFGKLEASVRINIAVRMAKAGHARFGDAIERVLAEALPARIFAASSTPVGSGAQGAQGAQRAQGGQIESFGDVAQELITELAEAILAHAPAQLGALVPLLPDDAILLSELAGKSLDGGQREAAIALYDRVVALAIPDDGDERGNYLRALNNACVQAHAAGLFDVAVRIADRAQPMAAENPHIYHAAACAYVAVGDHTRALDQVKLAIEHSYEHIAKIEIDPDLGALLEQPELQALFRDWHARREGN